MIWTAKLFNNIADKIDAKKEKEEKQKQYCLKIQRYCKLIDTMPYEQKEFLQRFVNENSFNVCIEKTNYNINLLECINVRLWQSGLNISFGDIGVNLRASIDNIFFDVLNSYFKNN